MSEGETPARAQPHAGQEPRELLTHEDDREQVASELRATQSRWPRRVVFGLLAIGLFALAWFVPHHQYDKAFLFHIDCMRALPGADDPWRCRIDDRLGLAWYAPWTRDDAIWADGYTQFQIHQRLAIQAARVRLDALERDREAEQLFAWVEAHPVTGTRLQRELVDSLAKAGALAELQQAGARFDNIDGARGMIAAAGLGRGDIEGTTRLWLRDEPGHDEALKRGAWLCLVGERDAGERILLAALYESEYRRSWRATVLLACGAEVDERLLDQPEDRAWAVARRAATDPEYAVVWLRTHADDPYRLQVVAQAMRTDPSDAQLLGWLVAGQRDFYSATNGAKPRSQIARIGAGLPAFARGDGAPRYAPGAMVAAAREALARADVMDQDLNPDTKVNTLTLQLMRSGASQLAAEASVEFIIRGQLEPAAQAARLAREGLLPHQHDISAGLLIFAGEADEALALIDEQRATARDDVARLRLAELELRALTSLGRWQQARTRALELDELLWANDSGHVLWAWARLLSLKLDDVPVPARRPGCDERSELERLNLPELISWQDASEQRFVGEPFVDLRLDLGLLFFSHLADPERRELWLDTAFIDGFEHWGRASLWQRAEVARWFDDREAEQRWRAQLEQLDGLARTEDQHLLAHYAGL